jgi:short-subunit dehydrogenase
MKTANTALITGASGGIGYEFAKIAASKGYNIVLVARSKEKLEKIRDEIKEKYPVKVWIFAHDLSNPDTLPELIEEIDNLSLEIAILINNAGFGDYGKYLETSRGKELQMINLNVYALTYLTKIFYRRMLHAGNGKILNVASIASFLPGPYMAVYYATKAYVLSLTEALSAEARGSGVTLTALCPGPTNSNFLSNASITNNSAVKLLLSISKADAVARYGFRAMMRGQTIAIHGIKNKIVIFLINFIPRKLVALFNKWYQSNWKV